jgi:hypothetical protein
MNPAPTFTLTLNSAMDDLISSTGMVAHPRNVDEEMFADVWRTRIERRYGHGYRVSLTAPAWVLNWIADTVTFLLGAGVEATPQEKKGARQVIKQVKALGIHKPHVDRPTRLELIDAGYLDAVE